MSHLALLNHQTQAIKYPQAIFQTVSMRISENAVNAKFAELVLDELQRTP